MPNLNDSQIDIISKKIKDQSLKSFAFSNELIDHVCCRIEQLMDNGLSFENALDQTSHLYHRNEIKKIDKNFKIIFNYSGFINSFIIYASLLFYLCSWVFHIGQSDWIGLIAFVLVSILLLRYSILFYSDNNLRFKKSLMIFSLIGFILFFVGSLLRFIWLNYNFNGQHVMPVMLFSWLIVSVTGLVYLKALFLKKSNRLIILIGIVQVILACISLSTFMFPFTMYYIPLYATIIIIINIASFFCLYVLKDKGKNFLRLIIVSSSLIVFIYTPHKAIANGNSNKVQFEVKPKEEVPDSKLYLYLNYYKYGKEALVLEKESDALFKSEVIEFRRDNLKISYAILKDSIDIQKVLHNSEIIKHGLILKQADTVFSLNYNPN